MIVSKNKLRLTSTVKYELRRLGSLHWSSQSGCRPSLTTTPTYAAISDLVQLDYRWYENKNAIQPDTSLAAENTGLTLGLDGYNRHLRVNVRNDGAKLKKLGSTCKLRSSTAASTGWTDVGGLGSGTAWRGYDNAAPADGATLAASLLASSVDKKRQTYE